MIKVNIVSLKALGCLLIFWSIFTSSFAQDEQKQVLRHIVSFQFKEDVSEEKKTEAVQIFLDLKDQIPEIKTIEGGENISDKGLNNGFTHWFIVTFEDEAARDIYLPHPAHMEVVEKNKPLFKDLLVVDFWGKE